MYLSLHLVLHSLDCWSYVLGLELNRLLLCTISFFIFEIILAVLVAFLHKFCVCAQLCLTHCDPINCSPPGSCVHGIFLARILEWVAIPSSRVSSQLID